MSEDIQSKSQNNHEKPTRETGEIRILIVDDEPLIHELISSFISKREAKYFFATAPSEAFGILRNHKIDCIFMDLVLPGRSGIGLTKMIRNIYGYKSIYIIGMTGLFGGREAEECAAHGMNDFLRKPFKAENVAEVFQRFQKYRSKLIIKYSAKEE